MKYFTEYFSEDKKVSLTGYLLDINKEIPYMDPRPAVLVIPGGGYAMCSIREAEPIAMLFAASGYNTFVLNYSVGTKETLSFEKPFSEAQTALKYIRIHAKEFQTDPDKIAAIGFSAGGHLCSALGTVSDEKPNAIILGYPCTLREMCDKLCCSDLPDTVKAVTPDTPPTFIFAACDDGLVPVRNSLDFAAACADNGVECETHIFAEGGHGFSLSTACVCKDRSNPHTAQWAQMCIEWLGNHFFNF